MGCSPTAFWLDDLGAHANEVSTPDVLADLVDRARERGATRVDIAAGDRAAAISFTSPDSPSVSVELFDAAVRLALSDGHRATGCWVARNHTTTWDLDAASAIAVGWAHGASASTLGTRTRPIPPIWADQNHGDRIFELVERYRHLRGRHLITDADLHAFLLGTIGVAGASMLPLTEVVFRCDPGGVHADTAIRFARDVDASHEHAHSLHDGPTRRAWFSDRIRSLSAVDTVDAGALAAKLARYLECELGRKRIAAL